MLGHNHRLADGESELSRCLLLQGGGGERWCRRPLERFLGYVGNSEFSILALVEEGEGLVVGLEPMVELGFHLTLRAVGIGKAEDGVHTVERLTLEFLYVAFPLNDKADGDTLHASCRQGRFHLPPQHRREAETHQTVENAAGLLGVDEIHVEVTRMLYGRQDSGFCDFMEDDTARLRLVETENLAEVPADGLSLAVLIGCEPHFLCGLGVLLQFADNFFLFLRNDIMRFQGVSIYAQFLLFQVADVTVTGHDFIVFAKKFLNRLSLRGALYYY